MKKIKSFREFMDNEQENGKSYRSLTTIYNPILFFAGKGLFKKCGTLSVIESLIFVFGSITGAIFAIMFSSIFMILIYFPITFLVSYIVSFTMAYLRNKKPRMYLKHKIWQTGRLKSVFNMKNIFYDKQKSTIYRP